MDPDLRSKIANWLTSHAHIAAEQKIFKYKTRSSNSTKLEPGATECDGVVSESDISDPVAVKSVPPRRRTKGSIRILRDNIGMCSPKEIFAESGMALDQVKGLRGLEEPLNSSEVSMPDAIEKVITAHFIAGFTIDVACNYSNFHSNI